MLRSALVTTKSSSPSTMTRPASSVIQQRSKSNNHKRLSSQSSSPRSIQSDSGKTGNNKDLRNDFYHSLVLYLNNYYHLKSPLGRLRFLLVAVTLFTVLSIVLFHPRCYRRRAQGMLLCRISREMGLTSGLPPSRRKKESLPPQERSRLLLGIMTLGNDPEEKRRRASIRNTLQRHMAFDSYHNPMKQVCSLQDYTSNPLEYRFCQVVYTFLVGGNSEGTNLDFNKTYTPSLRYEQTTLFSQRQLSQKQPQNQQSQEQFPTIFDESDVTFLNVEDVNNVRKVFTWYDYSTKIRMERGRKFDYVAFTDTSHTIDVDSFLRNNIFRYPYSVTLTYAGIHLEKSQCGGYNHTHTCHRLINDNYMSDFVLLSKDMVEYCLSHNHLIQLDGLYPQDRPDIALANLFRFHPSQSLNSTHLVGILESSAVLG
mmetsp:Transcript_25842/g.45564  ORF Transcript_25842/g.45564 Transcript_25842/m.45564 type:complete len:425 (-) Transcript_25842:92-1366(-)